MRDHRLLAAAGPVEPTRRSLHAAAEWVLAPARHSVEARIGLRSTPDGFGTPVLPGGHQLRVGGRDLVVDDVVTPLTTLDAAARAAGVAPATATGTYEPQTAWDADAPLVLDAVGFFADWFEFATSVLEEVRVGSVAPSSVQLWPEHFDVAVDVGAEGHRVNLGASPGDDDHPLPYLYVGPWSSFAAHQPFWNEPFGASLGYEELLAATDQRATALAFLTKGRDLA